MNTQKYVPPLSHAQRKRLEDLEGIVRENLRAFFEVGKALMEIRGAQLYREKYERFDDYCKEEWGLGKAHAYRLIESAQIVSNLSPIGDIPKNENQIRPLTRIKDTKKQIDIWKEVNKQAAEKNIPVTGRLVEDAVKAVIGGKRAKPAPKPKPTPGQAHPAPVQVLPPEPPDEPEPDDIDDTFGIGADAENAENADEVIQPPIPELVVIPKKDVPDVTTWSGPPPHGLPDVYETSLTAILAEIAKKQLTPEQKEFLGYQIYCLKILLSEAETTSAGKKKESFVSPQTIADLYHSCLPELESVRILSDEICRNAISRQKESKERRTLAFWEEFFASVKNSAFLTGQNNRGWRANLRWLLKKQNFEKVLNNEYGGHNDDSSGENQYDKQLDDALAKFGG